jgi:hypothetical protein
MMSLFVEVFSVEKQCMVIVNLDTVIEIAPLAIGGCAIFFADGTGGKVSMRVKEDYNLFKQFVLQTVSTEDIEKKFGKTKIKDLTMDIPKL